jgi:hypothetical protein
MPEEVVDVQQLVQVVSRVVEGAFQSGGQAVFSREPEVHEKSVIEYHSRMRVLGMEKFNAPCYVSAMSFYRNEHSQQKKDACGVLIVYFEEEAAAKTLTALGYKTAKGAEEGVILDQCGEFCNFVAGHCKQEWIRMGLAAVINSAPLVAQNTIAAGVEFPYSQYRFQEVAFYLWKQKALVVDLCVDVAQFKP